VLDIAAGTVESRLFRARQHVRKLLPAYEPGRSTS
jgi:DNA-directed RNA polymerase specialized sigma24 family protein